MLQASVMASTTAATMKPSPATTVKSSSAPMGSSSTAAAESFASMKSSVGHLCTAGESAVNGTPGSSVDAMVDMIVVVTFMMLPGKVPCVTKPAPIVKVPPVGKVVPIAKVTKVVKIVMEVAEENKRREAHVKRRKETPTKRTIEDSIPRNERISTIIRIPIPTGSVPITHLIDLGAIHVGFRQVRRAQAAPAIQIVLGFFVELFWLYRPAGIEGQHVFALHLDVLSIHFDIGLALINANDIMVRVKLVQAGFGKSNLRAILRDDNVVLRVQFGHFHGGFTFVQAQFCVGQAGRNQHCRAVIAQSEKDARCQK